MEVGKIDHAMELGVIARMTWDFGSGYPLVVNWKVYQGIEYTTSQWVVGGELFDVSVNSSTRWL